MIHPVRHYLYDNLLPLVTTQFVAADGLFHERLQPDLKPGSGANRRLTAQCRQVFTVCLLSTSGQDLALAERAFDLARRLYYQGPGRGWIFSIDPEGKAASQERDLYAHSFVLLACAGLLGCTKKEAYLSLARETLSFIETRFRHTAGGFSEALNSALEPIDRTRRQNPHMHLFESCLAMYEQSHDQAFLNCADEMLRLFTSKFLDPSSTLHEYFDQELRFCPARGHIVEAGHHFEWAYLLHDRVRVNKDIPEKKARELRELGEKLTRRGLELGWDKQRGGIYDETTPSAEIVSSSKRIWPLMEGIKAVALYNPEGPPSLDDLIRFAFDYYLHSAAGGAWTEQLDADLRPLRSELPATTPYHIAVSLMTLLRK